MHRAIPWVVSLALAASPGWGQAPGATRTTAAIAPPAGVSPGGSADFLVAESCPAFSWTAVAGARGYELRAWRIEAGRELEPAPTLEARLPAGASSWTPPADACLEPGRYAWTVRAEDDEGEEEGDERGSGWSEALFFEIGGPPTAAELQRALEVVQRYRETTRVGEEMSGTAEANLLPTRAVAAPESPRPREQAPAGGGPATAVRGEVPDAAGETYGVRGLSNSPDGAGVRADNNAAGADLVLGGSPVAELTESSLSRDSAANLTFDVTNPGAGTMTLEVDGNPVFHSGNDGSGSGLDADLLDGLDSTAFLASGTDDWVDETGDTMTGTLTLAAGDLALHTAATVTKAGARFLWDDAGNGSFATGRGALASNTTGSNNTAVGTGALDANTTANSNTALGRDALGANTTGGYNTALGRAALGDNTTGFSNTAVGGLALDANTTGGLNTALGVAALGDNTTGTNNTAVGTFALDANTTGGYNTALGRDALGANTTGLSNTAVGAYALAANTTGTGNTAIGTIAGSSITTTSNNIMIDNAGVAGDTNRIRIGDTQTETFIAGISGNITAGGIAVLVNGSGELGTSTSSRRFKEEIAAVGEESAALLALQPVSFRYTAEAAGQGERPLEYGLIAEEVAEVWPELVITDAEGRPYTVRYHLLVPLLLAEVQRLDQRLDRERREAMALLAAQQEELRALRRGIEQASAGPPARGAP